ncbi:hypothetical protein [Parabacteroides provencensis]|uniref:hypothetical protein n=1 Tax=Parabacteroides provencensis TaxID=1944636 RepID=UPI000C156068|nr:hypothetical protein [Parabacteroides provencensis]
MTDLFIDGKQVVLPKGMDLKVKQQNPLITKNGTFTLDLSLSLKERNNSILYKHIERLQSAAVIEGRSAVLISNGHVILNGTEAFISNTNEEVKIQLLSGNSELNYFIGADSYISSLDLGKETDISSERFNQVIRKRFPEVAFACPMVKIGSKIYNDHREMSMDVILNKPYNFSNLAIQPYLLAMIEKILSALGYVIEYNEARNDDFLSRIFILNNDQTGEYNKILPGWKVKEFLEECEKLMNIVFIINDANRSVRILCASSKAETGTYTIENVLDTFERTTVDDDPRISYKNVCYDLPSSKDYKYQNIDESVLEKAIINESKTYTDLVKKLTNSKDEVLPDDIFDQYYNSNTLFYVTETDTYYVLDKYLYKWLNSPTGASVYIKNLLKVNTFRKYTSNPDDDYLKLSFFPCLYISRPNDSMYVVTQRMPYLPGADDTEEEEAKNIRQLIENGVSDFNANKKPVSLCTFHPSDLGYYFTLTDNVADNDNTTSWYQKSHGTFRLVGPEGLVKRYYQPSQQISATKEYTIKFIINTMPNIQSQFLLNNKLFICKELEYRITNDGIHPEVTGIFYEVK